MTLESNTDLSALFTKTAEREKDLKALSAWSEREQAAQRSLATLGITGMFDGMGSGGSGSGMIASRITSGAVAERLAKIAPGTDAAGTMHEFADALRHAHDEVAAHAFLRAELVDIGTTADLVRVIDRDDGSYQVAFAHVGDARIYRWNAERRTLEQITRDDSYAREAMEKGDITPDEYATLDEVEGTSGLRVELQELFEKRNTVLNSIGHLERAAESIPIQLGYFEAEPGDRILILSDGIHDNLTTGMLEALLRDPKNGPAEIAAAAQKYALKYTERSKDDDATVVMVELGTPSVPKAPEAVDAVTTATFAAVAKEKDAGAIKKARSEIESLDLPGADVPEIDITDLPH